MVVVREWDHRDCYQWRGTHPQFSVIQSDNTVNKEILVAISYSSQATTPMSVRAYSPLKMQVSQLLTPIQTSMDI